MKMARRKTLKRERRQLRYIGFHCSWLIFVGRLPQNGLPCCWDVPFFQVALDEAAFLLDLASIEGTWDDSVERISGCYAEAGLHDIAKFVLYRD